MEERPIVVVVVDDEESVRSFVRRSLERVGCETHDASHGRAGIDAVLEFKPDLVFVDVRMPVIEGFEVCRYVKRRLGDKVKVVVMSGFMGPSAQEWALQCGADDTLAKPFGREELVKKVLTLTGERS